MARAIWSGSISFGLVTIPVRMVRAVQPHDLHFEEPVDLVDGLRASIDASSKAKRDKRSPGPTRRQTRTPRKRKSARK